MYYIHYSNKVKRFSFEGQFLKVYLTRYSQLWGVAYNRWSWFKIHETKQSDTLQVKKDLKQTGKKSWENWSFLGESKMIRAEHEFVPSDPVSFLFIRDTVRNKLPEIAIKAENTDLEWKKGNFDGWYQMKKDEKKIQDILSRSGSSEEKQSVRLKN